MMNPMLPPVVHGSYVMGDGYVMGAAPHLAHPAHRVVHAPPMHVPAWRAGAMAAPGLSMPKEHRKILPVAPMSQDGIFAAVTDRISFQARPQKAFLGERPVFDIKKVGSNAEATSVRCSLFSVGTEPQQVELGEFSVEDLTGSALDLNMAMNQAEPGMLIRWDLFLVGPAFTPGTDSIAVALKIYGRSIG